MDSPSELWYVQLSDGDVHRVTLDQLDEGFQAGHIDASTMVLAAGANRWTRLGELAGIGDVSTVHASPALVPPAFPSLPSPPALVPPPPLSRPASPAPLVESHRPVSVDLSDLDVFSKPARTSRKRWLAAAIGVAVVGGVAGVGLERPSLFRFGLNGAHASAVAAASVTASPPTADTSMPAAPTAAAPPVAPSTEPTALPTTTTPPPRLGNDAKPQAHGAGPKAAPRKGRAKAPLSADSPSKAPPSFASGGNKFDPLSSSVH